MVRSYKIAVVTWTIVPFIFLSFYLFNKWSNEYQRTKMVFVTFDSDWVVVHYSGERIANVWKLEGRQHAPEIADDRFRFVSSTGAIVNVGGNVKFIRFPVRGTEEWNNFHEYHAEQETETYENKYKAKSK